MIEAMHLPLSPSALRRVRHHISGNLPDVPSAHIAEALARALGHNTAISLKTTGRAALPGSYACADPKHFSERLGSIGHAVSPEAAELFVTTACASERASFEGVQSDFLRIVEEAVGNRANDIHIVFEHDQITVRFRVDGIMMESANASIGLSEQLGVTVFKTDRSGTEDYSLMEYQNARIGASDFALPNELVGLRLQFNPLPRGGRYVRVYLLYKDICGYDLCELGFTPAQKAQLQNLGEMPFGITFFTGPMGSGKSTVLHQAALARTRGGIKQLFVLEDPVERDIPGSVRLKMTEVFPVDAPARSPREFLSEDSILVVGSVRDRKLANFALSAAMIGLPVITTISANDAIDILDRLSDMGIDDVKVTDHTLISGLVSQRMIRVLCPHCSIPWDQAISRNLVDADIRSEVETIGVQNDRAKIRVVSKLGCQHCRNGITGRELVAEVIQVDRRFAELFRSRDRKAAMEHWMLHLDGTNMLENAVAKMLTGRMDPRDVSDKVGELSDISADRMIKIRGIIEDIANSQ